MNTYLGAMLAIAAVPTLFALMIVSIEMRDGKAKRLWYIGLVGWAVFWGVVPLSTIWIKGVLG